MARERFPEATFEAQDLCTLDLPARSFDGAFANASLQHVPTPALPNALTNIYACLRPGGVLLISAPLGKDAEGWSQARSKETKSLGRLAVPGDARTPLRGRGLRIRDGAHGPVLRGLELPGVCLEAAR